MADNPTEITKTIQVAYMATIRKKLGEFMLVIKDLIDRKVIKPNESLEFPTKSKIETIIQAASESSTSNWADSPEMLYLSTLLYNNGYPVQIINKTAENSEIKFPPSEYFYNKNALYKMYIVYTNATGGGEGSKNHYTIAIPEDLNALLENSQLNLEKVTDNSITEIGELKLTKYKIPGDGHCFYTAIATWCVLYGLAKHLENLSYNIPFEYDKDSHNKNLKVMPSSDESIPKPIEMPDFKGKAVKIAKNMINMIRPAEGEGEGKAKVSPTFDEEKDITDSDEYKAYLTKIKNDELHCNKYKGNKEEEEP